MVTQDILDRLLALEAGPRGWTAVRRDAIAEIEQLRTAGDRLKQTLLVVSNVWGRWHVTDEDAKYHRMVDKAIDQWQEARRV